MWVIKVHFGDGTWYRGVLNSRVSAQKAKGCLLSNFNELFSKTEIRQRGGATYKIENREAKW